MKNIEYEIELINNIIYESVRHGGDAGGAYYSNTNEVLSAIQNWLNFHNLNEIYEIEYKEPYTEFKGYYNIVPRIVNKNKKEN